MLSHMSPPDELARQPNLMESHAAHCVYATDSCGRLTMNMVLVGPEFGIARSETVLGDFVLPSLEIAGPGMHWVEVSRAIGAAVSLGPAQLLEPTPGGAVTSAQRATCTRGTARADTPGD